MMAMVDVALLAAYRRASGSSPSAWFKGRRPSGAVLHSSRKPGVQRPCSDFTGMLRRLINCRFIIIITIICYGCASGLVLSSLNCQFGDPALYRLIKTSVGLG